MLEIIKYVTSDFFVFMGSLIFTYTVVVGVGWSLNAILIGLKGKECGTPPSINL